MDVYIFNADIYCEKCGAGIRRDIENEGGAPADPSDESSYDSDEYPKGPYGESGGEADCPQHCGGCGMFLENPLTSDGVEYVREKIAEVREDHRGGSKRVIELWAEFYKGALNDRRRPRD